MEIDILNNESEYNSNLINSKESLVIQINTDDESNILKMNKRLFKKQDIDLIYCNNRLEFLQTLQSFHQNPEQDRYDLTFVVLMDHMIDLDFGYEVIRAGKSANEAEFNFKMYQFAVSSSDDQYTQSLYHLLVEKFITKPLDKSKIMHLIEQIRDKLGKK